MDAIVTKEKNNGDDQRRTAILDAAARLIAERGYHAVRIADIARTVGASTGLVHYYFPTKDDVLRVAMGHGVNREFERHTSELRKIDGSYERLLRVIELQLPKVGPIRDELTIWLQYWAECSIRPELRPVHNEIYMRWHEMIARLVERGQRRGEFRSDVDSQTLALELTALIDGLVIHVLTGVADTTISTMRETLVAYVRDKLLPQKTGAASKRHAEVC